ncbi:MAG TPA: hypothetical protein VFZ93_02215 [Albitalea sp.]
MKRLAAALLAIAAVPAGTAPPAPLPATLSATGFHDVAKTAFTPAYPLWSDGTLKRRWIHLPPGAAIDKSDPDAWRFPVGTKLWKQFGYGAAPVETRLIERLPGGWRFATYVWNSEGTQATLAPEDGAELAVPGAPGGRYAVPSRNDCLACHEGPAVPVLGYSAVQLEPGAVAAASPAERAALGYLHGNCGHCHNDGALAGVELVLAQKASDPERARARVLASLVGRDRRFRERRAGAAQRVVPGDPGASVLVQRMASANPMARMPPLGVQVPDRDGIAAVERWIAHELQPLETPQ